MNKLREEIALLKELKDALQSENKLLKEKLSRYEEKDSILKSNIEKMRIKVNEENTYVKSENKHEQNSDFFEKLELLNDPGKIKIARDKIIEYDSSMFSCTQEAIDIYKDPQNKRSLMDISSEIRQKIFLKRKDFLKELYESLTS
jgi:hypothetical protein